MFVAVLARCARYVPDLDVVLGRLTRESRDVERRASHPRERVMRRGWKFDFYVRARADLAASRDDAHDTSETDHVPFIIGMHDLLEQSLLKVVDLLARVA